MIDFTLVEIVGIVQVGLVSWALGRFAKGLFHWDYYESTPTVMPSIILASLEYYCYVSIFHTPDMVPVSTILTGGLLGGTGLCLANFGLIGVLMSGKEIGASLGSILENFGEHASRVSRVFVSRWKGKLVKKQPKSVGSTAAQTEAQVQAPDWQTAQQMFDDIERVCERLRALLREGEAFNKISEISGVLKKIRSVVAEDSNKRSMASILLTDYLFPTEQALILFERLLKSNVASAQPVLTEMTENILPLMHTRIMAVLDQIHGADIALLSTMASVFELARDLEVDIEAEARTEAQL